MKATRRRSLLLIGLTAASLVLLAFLLHDFSRQLIVVRLSRYLWVAYLVSLSIPRWLIWTLFLAAVLFIAFKSLAQGGRASPRRELERALPPPAGPVEAERRWVRLASLGSYGRWRLAQRLADLAAEVIAYEEQMPPDFAKQALQRGEIELPPQVRFYLQAGLGSMVSHDIHSLASLWRRHSQAAPGSLTRRDAEQVILFLEDALEVSHERSDH